MAQIKETIANPLSQRGPCDSTNKSHFFSGVLVLYCCCIVSLFIFFRFSIVVMFFSRFDFYFSKANIESFFHCYSEVSGLCVSFILTHSLCFHPVSFLYLCFIVIFVMWMHQFEQFLYRCVCVVPHIV